MRFGRDLDRRPQRSRPAVIVRARVWALGLGLSCVAATIVYAQPLSPFASAKATALLREKYGCLGCHRLGGEGGHLAPALHDVRTRRDAAYIAAMIRDPQRVRPGAAMPRTRMPESDRRLITRFLGGEVAVREVAATSTPAPTDTNGASLYQTWCAGCHGITGQGNGPNATALPVPAARHADARTMSQRPDDSLYDIIDGGGVIMNRSPRMPAFGGSLSPTQIRALVAHIRTLCRCVGPAWSRDGLR